MRLVQGTDLAFASVRRDVSAVMTAVAASRELSVVPSAVRISLTTRPIAHTSAILHTKDVVILVHMQVGLIVFLLQTQLRYVDFLVQIHIKL